MPAPPAVFFVSVLVSKLSHVCGSNNTLEYFTLLQSSLRNYYKIKYTTIGF